MAGFCGKCGSPLEDDANVCSNCGTPVNEFQAPSESGDTSETAKKVQKIISIAIPIVIVILVLSFISGFLGYKGFLKKVMNAYLKADTDKLVEMSSDLYEYYDDDKYVDRYFESSIENVVEDLEDSVGHNCKFKYKVNEYYKLSGHKFEKWEDSIAYTDFDTDTVKKIVVADVTITAKKGKKKKTEDIEVYMSKEGNSWKLLEIRE